MKLAIWKTGHQIADTVADALYADLMPRMRGRNSDCPIYCEANICNAEFIDKYNLDYYDAHLAYGILRGPNKVFKESVNWFNIDRGYFNPGHFDGYYRISYKGTQCKYDAQLQKDIDFTLEPWQSGHIILIVPPTDAVAEFYNVDKSKWLEDAKTQYSPYIVKYKDDGQIIPWSDLKGVVTFNSSIGWQALQKGIPCISDSQHSIVGSYYSQNLIDYNLENVKTIERLKLFKCMRAHQFTLAEIRRGDAWTLIEYYLKNN